MVNFRGAFDTGYAVALKQEPDNRFGFLDGQVHSSSAWSRASSEDLAALVALIALAIAALSEFPAFRIDNCDKSL